MARTIIAEGDYRFEMESVTERPDGKILFALNAARQIRIEDVCEKPESMPQNKMMAWVESQMKKMMEEAKNQLGGSR